MTCLAPINTDDLRTRTGTPDWTGLGGCTYDEQGRPVTGVHRDQAGGTFFYRDHVPHRDGDLPAVIWDRGEQPWYIRGSLHREGDQPARVYPEGRREWYQHGGLHREDGPAVIDPGTRGFPLDECAQITPGRPYERWCRREFSRRAAGPLADANGEHREDGPSSYALDGSWERWHQEGFLHRADGPALRLPDGTESWYWRGRLHRDDGPAVTYPDGKVEFYRHGLRHRDDGPAVITAKGSKAFWLRGVRVRAPKGGGMPELPAPDGSVIITRAGRRYRLGVKVTDRPVRHGTAIDRARERARLTGTACVLRCTHPLIVDGTWPERAYDTDPNAQVIHSDDIAPYDIYEAQLLDSGHDYPQKASR